MSPDESSAGIEKLTRENEFLRRQLEKLNTETGRLREENERLRKELEEALRSIKRQAAPFSRRKPKKKPKRPGRKSGKDYGKRASRPVPERVDEEIPVPLPPESQCCGAEVLYEETRPQYQEDIVRKTIVRRFDIEVGRCGCCGKRIQGRHKLQTSDALGAAAVQIGPEALALTTHLNKEMGISHERAARVLSLGHGLEVSRGTLCRAVLRLGSKARPTYEELRIAVRRSDVNWMDETGWRVAASLHWLWACLSAEVTVYDILPGRGFEQAASILGEDWDGWLHRDGWAPYRKFLNASHQSCLNHFRTRCENLIEKVSPGAARFPAAVLELLRKALALGARHALQEISDHGLASATGRIEAAMEALLSKQYRAAANRRLAKHLRHEQPWLFTFLHCPGLDATNNAAEREMRPAVIMRKTWGGNRTEEGAQAQKVLMSVLRTCYRQGKDAFDRIVELLRSPIPFVLDIIPSAPP
jgi:transposase